MGHLAAFLLESRAGVPKVGCAPTSSPGALLWAFRMPICSYEHILVSNLVIRLSALCKDALVCVFLSFRSVDGAWDPASSQLKTFFLDALRPEGAGPAMAFRRTEGMSMIQALAMTVAEIPVFLYTTFGQVKIGVGCGPPVIPLASEILSHSSQGP